MVNLSVKIGKLKLKNPVMVASGTWGPEYAEIADMNSLGAVILKTITLKPRIGNPPPRVVETASGMLNSIGLENKGLEDFLENKLPALRHIKTPIIASIAGDDADEFALLARRLDKISRVKGLELNLSCPNIISRPSSLVPHPSENAIIAQDEKATRKIIEAVKKSTRLTVIAKLSPNVTDITKIASAAQDAGADAVSLVNTFVGMAVDIETKRPVLGNVTGGLSGPAIKPLALRMVCDTFAKIKIPIIGIGGIMDYRDAVEFILCGASAVQVGTANFVDPGAPVEVIKGIKKYLAENKISDINKLIGALGKGSDSVDKRGQTPFDHYVR